MTPAHHMPEDLLFEYATGACSEATALVTATHLSLCPGCRTVVARLEALGGTLLEDLEPAPLPPGSFERLMSRLEESERQEQNAGRMRTKRASRKPVPHSDRAPIPEAAILPAPLRRYLGDYSALKWKTIFPGVRQITLPVEQNGVSVRLMRTHPGFFVPRHTHQGREINLVLSGGFTDNGESFARGDVSVRDDRDVHSVWIDRGEDCVLLAVNEAPLIPVGLTARLLGAFLKF